MRYSIPAGSGAQLDVATTNRVLRNTYTLLAITMIPTVIGAYMGVLFPPFQVLGIGMGFVVFLAAMFGLQFMVVKNRNNAAGVGWLLGFTLIMGWFTGQLVGIAIGSYSNGAELVALAVGSTAAIFFGLAGYASVTKRDLSSMSFGKILFIGMWMLFAISITNWFFQSSAVSMALSSMIIIMASGFIIFTINRVVRGGEDNYIMATMTIYIMLINLFQSILHLLMIFGGSRD